MNIHLADANFRRRSRQHEARTNALYRLPDSWALKTCRCGTLHRNHGRARRAWTDYRNYHCGPIRPPSYDSHPIG
jgi:hypothetical protein